MSIIQTNQSQWIEFKIKVPFYKQSSFSNIKIALRDQLGFGLFAQVFACEAIIGKSEFHPVVKIIPIDQHLFKEESKEEEMKDNPTTVDEFNDEAKLSQFMGENQIGPRVWVYDVMSFDKNDERISKLKLKDEIQGKCKFGMIVMDRLQYSYSQYRELINGHFMEKQYKQQIRTMFENQALKAFRLAVVHGDLHSGKNIMLNVDNDLKPTLLKIIDWGIVFTPEQLFAVSINEVIE